MPLIAFLNFFIKCFYPKVAKGENAGGCKSKPLVNADAFLLTNRGSEALLGFRCQVSGVRVKVNLEIRGGYKECIPMLNGFQKTLERKVPERERRWQLAKETAVLGMKEFFRG
ncbi:MAG: hypothetical protein PVG37_06795 [Desulfobacterales bacterium]|jgi:hypothetical protein